MKIFSAAVAAFAFSTGIQAGNLPDSVFVGGQAQHVQGIAYDSERDCMYMSFTSRFLKVDMEGNILASIDRIQGHLGAMTFNPVDRKVYASLECKDDEIGRGIAKVLDVNTVSRADSRFYIAIIDVDKMDGIGMDPENNDVLRTVCVRKAVEDYAFKGEGYEHRYGCSGIDGVAIAPEIAPLKPALYSRGAAPQKMYLYVAYGIYSDTERSDNDYQVVQRYDLEEIAKLSRPVVFGETHESGPKKPGKEYFVNTGNTNYGVQNMTYDAHTGCIYMAVYKGKKPQYPNYTLFAVSVNQKPFKAALKGGRDRAKRLQLRLVERISSILLLTRLRVSRDGVSNGVPAVCVLSVTADGISRKMLGTRKRRRSLAMPAFTAGPVLLTALLSRRLPAMSDNSSEKQ